MSSIVPLSRSERGESLSRIDDVQQTIKENLLGAFDVNKIQAAFDILFGIISAQQGEIDKLNKDVKKDRERTDTLETAIKYNEGTVQYNEKEQQVINADQSLEISQMKKQMEALKKSLSDTNERVVEIKEGNYITGKSRAAVETELMAASDKENMEFPSADDQDKNPLFSNNKLSQYERNLQSKRHSLDSNDSRPISVNNIKVLGENLREFTTDIAEYYDSIEVILNENLIENGNENGVGVSLDCVSALSNSDDDVDSQPLNHNFDGIKGSPAVSSSQSR
jgi:hypothetical protein